MDVVTSNRNPNLDLWVLGAGSHGRDIECIAIDCGEFVRFADDDPTKGYPAIAEATGHGVIGVWEPRARARIHESLDMERVGFTKLIHPAARVGRGCYIGRGCVIGPGAILTNDVVLGDHVHVGAGAVLTRCTVGPCSTISNGATVLGDVTIGHTVLVGGNAVVRNLLTVGDGAVIGCGANVIRDVEANTAVAGNPAKTLGLVP